MPDMLPPAYGYLRKSSESEDAQENSIPRQRDEVLRYAANKYTIMAWFIDEASGSKNQDKRVEFQRMLLAISGNADDQQVRAVVCWNRARFGRIDAYDGGLAVNVLRSNGVILDSVREGEFDFSQTGGRWKDYALSEAAKLFSVTLSADTLSGRLRALQEGYWPNGAVPYGYDRCYVVAGGRTHLVPRSQTTDRPVKSKLTLVINEPEAAIVREVFTRYATEDTSIMALAADLQRRGVPSPDTVQKRKHHGTYPPGWRDDTLKAILKNRAYLGFGSIGLGRKRVKEAFNRAQPTEVAGCCPAIVDLAVFNAVQSKLARKRLEKRKTQPDRAGLLSGFVLCAHCGFRLSKKQVKGVTSYVCASGVKRPQYKCRQWSIREDVLLPQVLTFLRTEVDNAITARSQVRVPEAPDDRAILEAAVKALKGRIETAGAAILAVKNARLLPILEGQMTALVEEMEGAERRLELMSAMEPGALEQFRAWWHAVKDKLILVSNVLPHDFLQTVGGPVIVDECVGTTMLPEQFRELLARLGLTCRVAWDQDSGYFPAVQQVEIACEVKHPMPCRHATARDKILSFSRTMAAA